MTFQRIADKLGRDKADKIKVAASVTRKNGSHLIFSVITIIDLRMINITNITPDIKIHESKYSIIAY
jgi:hypothetical protein